MHLEAYANATYFVSALHDATMKHEHIALLRAMILAYPS